MKRNAHEVALLYGNDASVVQCGKHANSRPYLLNEWRPNKDSGNHIACYLGSAQSGLEGFDLGTERIAANGNVQTTERLLIVCRVAQSIAQHDEARAGAKHRHSGGNTCPERLAHAKNARQLVDDGRFATRDDESVDELKIRRSANSSVRDPECIQRTLVLADVALEGEHAYQGRATSHVQKVGAEPGGPTR